MITAKFLFTWPKLTYCISTAVGCEPNKVKNHYLVFTMLSYDLFIEFLAVTASQFGLIIHLFLIW